MLAFVIDEDHPFPGKLVEKGIGAEQLEALKAGIRLRHVTDTFTTPDSLKAAILDALPDAIRRLAGVDPGVPTPTAPNRARVVVGLPHENRLFTGRSDLLDALAAAATERAGQATALTALRGMGGVGKSAVALAYAHRVREAGKVPVIGWISAETETELMGSLATLGAGLDLNEPEPEDLAAAARGVVAWCEMADRPWLLVYDNAQSPASVRDWIPTGGPGQW